MTVHWNLVNEFDKLRVDRLLGLFFIEDPTHLKYQIANILQLSRENHPESKLMY